jgi:hypothetical protein
MPGRACRPLSLPAAHPTVLALLGPKLILPHKSSIRRLANIEMACTESLVHEPATYRGREAVDGEDYDDGGADEGSDLGVVKEVHGD